MPEINPISGKVLLKKLEKHGYGLVKTRGSHHFLLHSTTKVTTTIPVHNNTDLDRGLIRKIIRDLKISVEEYKRIVD
jgi:predicted RNA binding protein YcfA (HicA-like mRNA interferase family)